jgi:oligopeptidase B
MRPPRAEKRPEILSRHGDEREDPYAWLRDANWQKVMKDPAVLAPDIRNYLEAENEYTAHVLEPTQVLQDKLFEEMKGRIKEDDSTVPAPDGDFSYYSKFRISGQYPIFCRHRREDAGSEVILLDGDAEAGDKPFFKIGNCKHSPDHRYVAYSIDDKGSEYFTIALRDVESGTDLPDRIENSTGDVEWANDGKTLFYIQLDDNHRPSKVFRHSVGSDTAGVLIYEEDDPGFFVNVSKSESGKFIFISVHNHETSEVRFISADAPDAGTKLIELREKGVEYHVSEINDRFVILTNADGAEDFKIVETPIFKPARENWQDLVFHQTGRLIPSILAFKNRLVRLERVDALARIIVTHLHDDGQISEQHEISFDEEAYSLGLVPGYEFDTTTLRFAYSSPTTPQQVYDYDMGTRERTLRKTQEIPSGHNPDDYVARHFKARAQDDETIPVTLLYHRTTPLDGSAPLLLYGYGSYGLSIPASFSTSRLSLVDRGFVFAIAHIRGGKDRGYRWYREGKLAKKKNTFTDFISVAEKLIDDGYTSKGNIITQGGSAGGLLMGAVANMAPDLFLGIIAEVPFVDVLTTICDDTLPLTPPEWPEWGNPIADKLAYDTIKSYSPYDNVTAQDYPNILVTAGLTDPRVIYWEPAKWVAKLRLRKTDDNLLILNTNMEAGHAGSSGRFKQLKETALNYAFALMISGRSS